jgi:hypothetical protein
MNPGDAVEESTPQDSNEEPTSGRDTTEQA